MHDISFKGTKWHIPQKTLDRSPCFACQPQGIACGSIMVCEFIHPPVKQVLSSNTTSLLGVISPGCGSRFPINSTINGIGGMGWWLRSKGNLARGEPRPRPVLKHCPIVATTRGFPKTRKRRSHSVPPRSINSCISIPLLATAITAIPSYVQQLRLHHSNLLSVCYLEIIP